MGVHAAPHGSWQVVLLLAGSSPLAVPLQLSRFPLPFPLPFPFPFSLPFPAPDPGRSPGPGFECKTYMGPGALKIYTRATLC